MLEKNESFLVIQIERETGQRSEDYSSRQCSVHFRNKKNGELSFYHGYTLDFRDIGQRIAIINRYQNGMLNRLNVDAAIEIDGGPYLEEPFIFEQTFNNTDGMSLYGIPEIDEERLRPDQSMESIMLIQGGDFTGPLKSGFIPREEILINLGTTLDNKNVRIKIKDMRPKPPLEISQKPLPRS